MNAEKRKIYIDCVKHLLLVIISRMKMLSMSLPTSEIKDDIEEDIDADGSPPRKRRKKDAQAGTSRSLTIDAAGTHIESTTTSFQEDGVIKALQESLSRLLDGNENNQSGKCLITISLNLVNTNNY